MAVHTTSPGIDGVKRIDLRTNADKRGELIELFREDWNAAPVPRQWNLVRSRPNSLRGVHVHLDHDDYITVLQGRLHLGLYDPRPLSPTFSRSDLVAVDSSHPAALFVPRGVMHGFCFVEETTYLYGLSGCWSAADDLGCLWSDPDLGISWPVREPHLSTRDTVAGSLRELEAHLQSQWKSPP